MRCEHRVMGRESWHEQAGQPGWRDWCTHHTAPLARAFLSRVSRGDEAREFFGDWYDIDGWKLCGYSLGHEAVKTLEDRADLPAIATLAPADVAHEMTRALQTLAAAG